MLARIGKKATRKAQTSTASPGARSTSSSGAMAMMGVTCSTMAKGISARSIHRDREIMSASVTPPIVFASASASSAVVRVTSSAETRISRSLTSVWPMTLAAAAHSGAMDQRTTTASQTASAPMRTASGSSASRSGEVSRGLAALIASLPHASLPHASPRHRRRAGRPRRAGGFRRELGTGAELLVAHDRRVDVDRMKDRSAAGGERENARREINALIDGMGDEERYRAYRGFTSWRRRSSPRRKRVTSSSAAKGSSISSSCGRVTRARAMATRIFMPPESWRGRRRLEVQEPAERQRLGAPAAPRPRATCRRGAAADRHWRRHRPGQQRRLLEHEADIVLERMRGRQWIATHVGVERGRR